MDIFNRTKQQLRSKSKLVNMIQAVLQKGAHYDMCTESKKMAEMTRHPLTIMPRVKRSAARSSLRLQCDVKSGKRSQESINDLNLRSEVKMESERFASGEGKGRSWCINYGAQADL